MAMNEKPSAARRLWGAICRLGRMSEPTFAWLSRIADPLSKWATVLAVVGAGIWAYYQFNLGGGGGGDWAIDLALTTEVIPYSDKTALLVVHIRAKNPRISEVNLEPPDDKYVLRVRQLPEGLPSGTVIDPDTDGKLIKEIDLLPKDGYIFAPGADFEDEMSMVLPIGSKVALTAELDYNNDYVATNKIVVVDLPAK
jgi:hypothetical protein